MKTLFHQSVLLFENKAYRNVESIDLSGLQEIKNYENLKREVLESRIQSEIEMIEHQIPNDLLEEVVGNVEKDVLTNIKIDVDGVVQSEMNMSPEEVKKKLNELVEASKKKADEWKNQFNAYETKTKQNIQNNGGVVNTLVNEYKNQKSSFKKGVRDIILESIQEDIKTKNGGIQPDSWVKYQSELVYDTMGLPTKMMYLSYVATKRATQVPGKIVDASKEAWANTEQFLKETAEKAGETYESLSDSVIDFFDGNDPIPNTHTLTPQDATFWTKIKQLPDKIVQRMKTYTPDMWDYMKTNFREVEPALHSYENAEWFDPQFAVPAALTGMYVSTYLMDSGAEGGGLGTMLKTSALFAGMSTVPKVTVPLLNMTTAVAKGTGRVVGDGLGLGWNAGMSFVRDSSRYGVFANPKFALDGNWESTRQQEQIQKHLYDLDTHTAEWVPDIIQSPYNKIVNNKIAQVSDKDIDDLSSFCVKSLDKNIFMGQEEFLSIQAQLQQSGGDKWSEIGADRITKMLNSAYQKRIVAFFLLLPDGDTRKEAFKSQFIQKLATRKQQELEKTIDSADVLNLTEMYADKIDVEYIDELQKKGIAGDVFQNKNALATLGIPIALLYALVMSIVGMKNLVAKQKEKKAKEKLEKMKDGITEKGKTKIKEQIEGKIDRDDLLALLVAEKIISSSEKSKLNNINEDDFVGAIENGQFRYNLDADLQTLSQSFWDDIQEIGSNELSEFDELKTKSMQRVQMERLQRKIKRGESISKIDLKSGTDAVELFDVQQNVAESLQQGWKNLSLPGVDKKKSFVFQARLNDTTSRFALVEKNDGVFLYQLKGRDLDLDIGKESVLDTISFT